VLQFGPKDFHPGFDQTFLWLRQATAKALNRVDGENGRVHLVVRVEMGPMVGLAGFDLHRIMLP